MLKKENQNKTKRQMENPQTNKEKMQSKSFGLIYFVLQVLI